MMERFISALSLTLLLTGLAAVAQVQPSFRDPIDEVVQAGLMTRFPDGNFREKEGVSRAELARVLVKTFHLDEYPPKIATAVPLEDVPPSYWAYHDIQLVLRNGIMMGYREGRFYPDQRVTRAEAFAIFAQAHGVFQFSDQTIREVLDRYPDAAKIPDWARKSMATALFEGFVNLRNQNQIDPLSPMTREDMAYALNLYLAKQQPPSDFPWQSTRSIRS